MRRSRIANVSQGYNDVPRSIPNGFYVSRERIGRRYAYQVKTQCFARALTGSAEIIVALPFRVE
jgi:hypothetical protein